MKSYCILVCLVSSTQSLWLWQPVELGRELTSTAERMQKFFGQTDQPEDFHDGEANYLIDLVINSASTANEIDGIVYNMTGRVILQWFVSKKEEEALGKDMSKISDFGKAIAKLPRSWVEKVKNMNPEKYYRYMFSGSFNHLNKHRTWLPAWVKQNFNDEDYFRATDGAKKIFEGMFDHTGLDTGGFRPKGCKGKCKTDGFEFDKSYWNTMKASRFIVCPGGDAPYSFRFYESFLAGALPVINNYRDDWDVKARIGLRWVSSIGYEHLMTAGYPHQYDTAMKEMADRNFQRFIRYQTWLEGDNDPVADRQNGFKFPFEANSKPYSKLLSPVQSSRLWDAETMSRSKPRLDEETPKSCTLTFAPHSGFGNQLWGALGAGYIANITGCKLQMPPILGHGKKNGGISYGSENSCLNKNEQQILSKSQASGRKSKFTYDQIFNYTSLISTEPSDPSKLVFLPVHCGLWKEKNQNEKEYADYLKEFIKKTNPTGAYAIGSGYNTGAPRLHINDLFESFSAEVEKDVSNFKDKMRSMVSSGHEFVHLFGKETAWITENRYACVHLRSGDKAMSSWVHDHSIEAWVSEHLAGVKKPLLIASVNAEEGVHAVMQNVCSKTQCIRSHDIMPPGDHGVAAEGKAMLTELALCSRAEDIYLPNAHHKILGGQFISAPSGASAFRSTFSDTISEMAFWHADTKHENVNHPWRRPL